MCSRAMPCRFLQGLYRKRIEQLAADVRAADPDIIAFQEVRHDAERDSQAATLACEECGRWCTTSM